MIFAIRSSLVALLWASGAVALFYHPSDPCNLVPYDYLRTQLCCNGTVYADPPFIYTCCYDFVCYRVNNMPVDAQILHPISRYYPATNPGLASGQNAMPGVPVPQGVFAPPDYDMQEPSMLINGQTQGLAGSNGLDDSEMANQKLHENLTEPVMLVNGSSAPSNAVAKSAGQDTGFIDAAANATTVAPVAAEKPAQQVKNEAGQGSSQQAGNLALQQQQQMRMDPFRMPGFPMLQDMSQFARQAVQPNVQNNPYYIRNQGPIHQYFLPLGKQFFNPFQQMFQPPFNPAQAGQQPVEAATTTQAASTTAKAPIQLATTPSAQQQDSAQQWLAQQQPGFIQFLQNMFPKEMPFPQFPQKPAQQQVVATTTTQASTTTTESPDNYCDGINLSLLQQANPSLACCAKMVIYDSRLYSCVESETSTTAASENSTTAAPTQPTTVAPVQVTTTHALVPAVVPEAIQPVEVAAVPTANPPVEVPQLTSEPIFEAGSNNDQIQPQVVSQPFEGSVEDPQFQQQQPQQQQQQQQPQLVEGPAQESLTLQSIDQHSAANNFGMDNGAMMVGEQLQQHQQQQLDPMFIEQHQQQQQQQQQQQPQEQQQQLPEQGEPLMITGGDEPKGVAPAKRSAKLSAAQKVHQQHHHDFDHLPADFVPLTCGIHEYYIDPSISTKFACCGDAVFDVTLELCEHVWGMYYAMAAVPINEDGKPPAAPARLDCSELKTYIFGSPSIAANYSC